MRPVIVKVPLDQADLEAARSHAVAVARQIMALDNEADDSRLSWHIDITDAAGRVVLIVPFSDTVTSGSA